MCCCLQFSTLDVLQCIVACKYLENGISRLSSLSISLFNEDRLNTKPRPCHWQSSRAALSLSLQIYFCITRAVDKVQSLRSCWLWREFVYDKRTTVQAELADICYKTIFTLLGWKGCPRPLQQLFRSERPFVLSLHLAWLNRAPAKKKKHNLSIAGLCQQFIHLYNYQSTKGTLYNKWLQVKDTKNQCALFVFSRGTKVSEVFRHLSLDSPPFYICLYFCHVSSLFFLFIWLYGSALLYIFHSPLTLQTHFSEPDWNLASEGTQSVVIYVYIFFFLCKIITCIMLKLQQINHQCRCFLFTSHESSPWLLFIYFKVNVTNGS